MALLTSHSSANLVIDSGLVVTYSKKRISGSWSWTAANMSGDYLYMMEFTRHAQKSYRYVGMEESAARQCQAAMIEMYTRDFSMSIWNDATAGGSWSVEYGGTMPMAEVAMSRNDDGSYDVVINVNEIDTRIRKVTDGGTFSVIFSSERLRGYDGETEIPPSEEEEED